MTVRPQTGADLVRPGDGWRIPFIVGLGVGLGGLAIRRHYVERVPHQAPAKSPLGEAFRSHWRTMLHLVSLVAAISVGFYTTFVYAATWLEQGARVPARTALEINTVAMALSLLVLAPYRPTALPPYRLPPRAPPEK